MIKCNYYKISYPRTDSYIKECVPGIINDGELKNLDKHKSELKDNELWYRVQQK
jgi:hypothetical protein